VAFGCGVYWLTASGELPQLAGRPFVFLAINSQLASIGCAYFLYDTLAMTACAGAMKPAYFMSMLCHHFIFVAAYFSTLVRYLLTT
jgi:uncharacterized membrane protein